MAHTCPECGMLCHCGGDIDDLDFGEFYGCSHCDPDDWDDDENFDENEEKEENK